jgi:hypothetical protein
MHRLGNYRISKRLGAFHVHSEITSSGRSDVLCIDSLTRTKDFFRLIALSWGQIDDIRHDHVLPSGETIGEFCIWYIRHKNDSRIHRSKQRKLGTLCLTTTQH